MATGRDAVDGGDILMVAGNPPWHLIRSLSADHILRGVLQMESGLVHIPDLVGIQVAHDVVKRGQIFSYVWLVRALGPCRTKFLRLSDRNVPVSSFQPLEPLLSGDTRAEWSRYP